MSISATPSRMSTSIGRGTASVRHFCSRRFIVSMTLPPVSRVSYVKGGLLQYIPWQGSIDENLIRGA